MHVCSFVTNIPAQNTLRRQLVLAFLALFAKNGGALTMKNTHSATVPAIPKYTEELDVTKVKNVLNSKGTTSPC